MLVRNTSPGPQFKEICSPFSQCGSLRERRMILSHRVLLGVGVGGDVDDGKDDDDADTDVDRLFVWLMITGLRARRFVYNRYTHTHVRAATARTVRDYCDAMF